MEFDNIVRQISWVPAVIGAAGGFTAFLYAISTDKIKNNKTIRKCAAEILGGCIVAFFFAQIMIEKTGSATYSLVLIFMRDGH